MKSLKFFKPALATTLAIVLGWLLTVRPAEAGYTVTLQQVGPDVVATGSGAIDLTGLGPPVCPACAGLNPEIDAEDWSWGIFTGPTSSSVDAYGLGHNFSGPASFGSGGETFASSGSGDAVGTFSEIWFGEPADQVLWVPTGYRSGTFLSSSATWSGKTFATLGVTPGTYVWTWGTGANQNFTLQIGTPIATPPPDTVATPSISADGGRFRRQVVVTLMDATPGVAIYYTLDGSDPTTLSNVYINPFMLRRSATVKAIAVDSNFNHSAIATASFRVGRR